MINIIYTAIVILVIVIGIAISLIGLIITFSTIEKKQYIASGFIFAISIIVLTYSILRILGLYGKGLF